MLRPILSRSSLSPRTVVLLVSDSLRWDSYQEARTPRLDSLCASVERRFTYASWTQPSHTCILNGLLPHESPVGVPASHVYARDLGFWAHVLSGDAAGRRAFPPSYSLPGFAALHGWRSIGHVALPVLSPEAGYARGFHDYTVMDARGNVGAQFNEVLLDLSEDRNFIFINSGDTHYPYLLPSAQLPRVSGIGGAATRELLDAEHFSPGELAQLRRSQIEAVELLDKLFPEIAASLPKPLLFVITSDHGELFGESGYFGHGPFFHEKLFEVPTLIGWLD